MQVTIAPAGRIGLISDKLGHELPPQAWSSVQNVVFERGYARRGRGDLLAHSGLSLTPKVVRPVYGSNAMVAYSDNLKWKVIDAGTEYDITRASGDYTGTNGDKWTGGYFNGVQVFYNGVDTPQIWNPIATGTKLTDFSNWPTNTSAAFMRSYKTYLIAGDVTKSGTRYHNILKWSQAAIPGSEPASWDETDPTTFAGEMAINTGSGSPLVDAVPLGDLMLLCKKNGLAVLGFVGGEAVFDYRALSRDTGIVSTECAKQFVRGQVVMLTDDGDVAITDGQSIRSIAEGRVRSALLSALQSSNTPERSWVGVDRVNQQVAVFVPSGSIPDQVWLWDYGDNTWSYRAVGGAYSGETGLDRDSSGVPYFDSRLIIGEAAQGILHFNNGGNISGSSGYTSKLERVGLTLLGQTFPEGEVKADPEALIQVNAVWPLIEAPSGAAFTVTVGEQNEVNEAVTWGTGQTFTAGSDVGPVEWDVVTRFVALKFESTANVDWKFHGYKLNFEIVGAGQ